MTKCPTELRHRPPTPQQPGTASARSQISEMRDAALQCGLNGDGANVGFEGGGGRGGFLSLFPPNFSSEVIKGENWGFLRLCLEGESCAGREERAVIAL